jgi:predicted SAM-dependent methyltransferase
MLDPKTLPRKINLGAGYDPCEGFLCVDLHDFHDPDLVGDVRSLPELPDGHFDEIVAQDVLEHLIRDDVRPALREWAGLAAPGGRPWLWVPDLLSLMRRLTETDDLDSQRHNMRDMFGMQNYEGDFHHAGFTDVLLCDELFRAGFGDVEMELRDGWMWEAWGHLDASPVEVAWGYGFSNVEHTDDALHSWRWSGPGSSLTVHRRAERDAQLRFTVGEASVVAHLPGGTDERFEPGDAIIHLQQGLNFVRVRFSCDHRVDAPGDPRVLSWLMSSARVMG